MSVASPTTPHFGQIGPFGQIRASSHSRALASLWKIGFERSLMAVFLSSQETLCLGSYYVKVIIPPARGRSTREARRVGVHLISDPLPSLPLSGEGSHRVR